MSQDHLSFDPSALRVNFKTIHLPKNTEETMLILEEVRLNNITLFYKMRFYSDSLDLSEANLFNAQNLYRYKKI